MLTERGMREEDVGSGTEGGGVGERVGRWKGGRWREKGSGAREEGIREEKRARGNRWKE